MPSHLFGAILAYVLGAKNLLVSGRGKSIVWNPKIRTLHGIHCEPVGMVFGPRLLVIFLNPGRIPIGLVFFGDLEKCIR